MLCFVHPQNTHILRTWWPELRRRAVITPEIFRITLVQQGITYTLLHYLVMHAEGLMFLIEHWSDLITHGFICSADWVQNNLSEDNIPTANPLTE